MRIRLIIEFSTPKIGGVAPEVHCRAHEVKKPILGTVWGGGGGCALIPHALCYGEQFYNGEVF